MFATWHWLREANPYANAIRTRKPPTPSLEAEGAMMRRQAAAVHSRAKRSGEVVETITTPPAKLPLAASAIQVAAEEEATHETAGADYKNAVRDTFVWCAENFDHWTRVSCVDDEGERVVQALLDHAGERLAELGRLLGLLLLHKLRQPNRLRR